MLSRLVGEKRRAERATRPFRQRGGNLAVLVGPPPSAHRAPRAPPRGCRIVDRTDQALRRRVPAGSPCGRRASSGPAGLAFEIDDEDIVPWTYQHPVRDGKSAMMADIECRRLSGGQQARPVAHPLKAARLCKAVRRPAGDRLLDVSRRLFQCVDNPGAMRASHHVFDPMLQRPRAGSAPVQSRQVDGLPGERDMHSATPSSIWGHICKVGNLHPTLSRDARCPPKGAAHRQKTIEIVRYHFQGSVVAHYFRQRRELTPISAALLLPRRVSTLPSSAGVLRSLRPSVRNSPDLDLWIDCQGSSFR